MRLPINSLPLGPSFLEAKTRSYFYNYFLKANARHSTRVHSDGSVDTFFIFSDLIDALISDFINVK